jgi:uncharacterized protein YjbI with pentapeptide repeats
MPSRPKPPGYAVTVIIKGGFKMTPEGVAEPIQDEADFVRPTSDLYLGDDKEASLRYASDFAHFKPRADVLLVGTCHVPDGTPTKACRVGMTVGERRKTLAVVGDRFWVKDRDSVRPTQPRPFTTMALTYENAFGGPDYGANPLGKGLEPRRLDEGKRVWALPNIEDLERLISAPSDRPQTAGFGPLAQTWAQRCARMGTYDEAWLAERWPGFPKDFDWGHFNAAPRDQQVKGYLNGDESLIMQNLHPEHAVYRCRLPGLRPRCFLDRQDDDGRRFFEVQMRLDTLWVDMDSERLVLVWRGIAVAKTPDHEEYQHLYLAAERLEDAALPVEVHHNAFMRSVSGESWPEVLAEEPEEAVPEALPEVADDEPDGAPEASDEDGPPAEEQPSEPEADPEMMAAMDHMVDQVKAQLAKAGIPAAIIGQFSLDKDPSEFLTTLYGQLGVEPAVARQQIAEAKEILRKDLAQQGLDPAMVDMVPNSPEATEGEGFTELKTTLDHTLAEVQQQLSEAGVPAPLLAALTSSKDPGSAIQGIAEHFGVDTSKTQEAMAEAREKLKQEFEAQSLDASLVDQVSAIGEEEEPEEAPEEVAARPEWEEVVEGHASGQSFAGQDFSGVDFSGMALKGVDFSDAILAGARFKSARLMDAKFTGANLADADLSEAYLNGAELDGADLQGANLSGTDLSGASLKQANLSQANLTGAWLLEAEAEGALMANANLTGARLDRGRFERTDLQGATLDRMRARGASFLEATFVGAQGDAVALTQCDLTALRAGGGCRLTGSTLRQVKAENSFWGDCDLTHSDLAHAVLTRADFSGGNLEQANLYAVDARHSVFDKAVMRKARITCADLFESRFERADLSGADLRGSNLYGAEFWDAVLDGTRLAQANVKMTKLARVGGP